MTDTTRANTPSIESCPDCAALLKRKRHLAEMTICARHAGEILNSLEDSPPLCECGLVAEAGQHISHLKVSHGQQECDGAPWCNTPQCHEFTPRAVGAPSLFRGKPKCESAAAQPDAPKCPMCWLFRDEPKREPSPPARDEVLYDPAQTLFIDIVFDGPPSAQSGRFVETEDPSGKSIRAGEWIYRKDGYWVLRIPRGADVACSSGAGCTSGVRYHEGPCKRSGDDAQKATARKITETAPTCAQLFTCRQIPGQHALACPLYVGARRHTDTEEGVCPACKAARSIRGFVPTEAIERAAIAVKRECEMAGGMVNVFVLEQAIRDALRVIV